MQDLFDITIHKVTGTGAGAQGWSNTYHIKTDVPVDVTSESLALDAAELLKFEKAFHSKDIIIDRAVISTHVKHDEDPSDGYTVIPFDKHGDWFGAADGNELGNLENVLVVSMSASGGGTSRLQYRGALGKSQLTYLGFSLVATNTAYDGVIAGLNALNASATAGRLGILSDRGENAEFRPMVKMTVKGPSNRQLTARRKAKISHDEDAIIKRLQAVIKEVALVDASIRVQNATVGIDVAKRAALLEQITFVKDALTNFEPLPA